MKTVLLMFAISACTLPAMFSGHGTAQQQTTQTQTESRSEEHTINGRPIEEEQEPPPQLATHHKQMSSKQKSREVAGNTCKTNADCDSKTCFVGRGELGYCTKMCNSFSDCPTFWECEHVGNAPQKICMQDKE